MRVSMTTGLTQSARRTSAWRALGVGFRVRLKLQTPDLEPVLALCFQKEGLSALTCYNTTGVPRSAATQVAVGPYPVSIRKGAKVRWRRREPRSISVSIMTTT